MSRICRGAYSQKEAASLKKETNQTLTEIAKVGELINQLAAKNPTTLQEIFTAVNAKYYTDEMVYVTDLLKDSDLYNYKRFTDNNASLQTFRKYAQDIISVSAINDNITLYMPYSENHDFKNYESLTVVVAQEDTDEAMGIRYEKGEPTKVIVNDEYAEKNPTLIVGINELRENATTYKMIEQEERTEKVARVQGVTQVSNSKAIMRKHLDALISFTGNGGGNEMRIARISAYLTPVNGHITSFDGDKKSVDFSRSDIKNKRVKTITSIWDFNWADDDSEQIYAVYEEDNENTKTFNGSLTTTLVRKLPDDTGSNTITATVGYTVNVKSKDPIVTQTKMRRKDYMDVNVPNILSVLTNDGKACIQDKTSLFATGNLCWPAYDCGADWSYTLISKQY